MEIYLARTQGFCSGVASAVHIVEDALKQYGAPLYVYHEIVHNTFIVSNFRDRGVVFVDDLNDIPEGKRVIFSAHGVPPSVIDQAKSRNLEIIDATCPLVKKVHDEAVRFSNLGDEVVLIGHKGHQEIIGTSGYVNSAHLHIIQDKNDINHLDFDSSRPVVYLTQTTLSVDDTKELVALLKEKFSNLEAPDKADICFATQQRQDAVKELAGMVDLIIVCGSSNSSNSNRLRETGEKAGIKSVIIDKASDLDMTLLIGKEKIGITSGASVPSCIVDELIEKIKTEFTDTTIKTLAE